MISLLRIDARIIHGQVVSAWIPQLRVDEVIVVDDEIADSPLMQGAMTLALPDPVKAKAIPFAQVDESLGAGDGRTLVLVRGVAEAQRIVDAGAAVPRLNLGNLHRQEGRVQVLPSVFLSEADFATIESLASRGIEVEARALPSDPPVLLDVLRSLLRAPMSEAESHAGSFRIVNQLGLHARAAAQLVQLANRFPCEITIRKEDQLANAKSIMGVLMLAAAQGSEIEVRAEGADAATAVQEIGALIDSGFGEDRG